MDIIKNARKPLKKFQVPTKKFNNLLLLKKHPNNHQHLPLLEAMKVGEAVVLERRQLIMIINMRRKLRLRRLQRSRLRKKPKLLLLKHQPHRVITRLKHRLLNKLHRPNSRQPRNMPLQKKQLQATIIMRFLLQPQLQQRPSRPQPVYFRD
ncbi:unnamed protein product [Meloidogyne enterolobii]|uniref:Uncharacterized protein n=1 Tax=Meloidogyne enterolobii TaxID=390850 RepID=A0ACB0XUX7_MELEN